MSHSYLVDVLALELRQQLAQAVRVGLNSNGVEDLLDVVGGGLLVAAEGEEEVSCEVLHFDVCCLCARTSCQRFARCIAGVLLSEIARG